MGYLICYNLKHANIGATVLSSVNAAECILKFAAHIYLETTVYMLIFQLLAKHGNLFFHGFAPCYTFEFNKPLFMRPFKCFM